MPSSASSPTGIYTLSLHDALPIWARRLPNGTERHLHHVSRLARRDRRDGRERRLCRYAMQSEWHAPRRRKNPGKRRYVSRRCTYWRSEEHTSELQSRPHLVCRLLLPRLPGSTLFPYTTLFRSGREGFRMVLNDIFTTFPDWHVEIVEMVAKDDSVVMRCKVSGTHRGVGKIPVNGGMLVGVAPTGDRKSTRLNSSHVRISYAVFCFLAYRDLHSFPTRRSSDLGAKASEWY